MLSFENLMTSRAHTFWRELSLEETLPGSRNGLIEFGDLFFRLCIFIVH